jgi:hypothetical protein
MPGGVRRHQAGHVDEVGRLSQLSCSGVDGHAVSLLVGQCRPGSAARFWPLATIVADYEGSSQPVLGQAPDCPATGDAVREGTRPRP